jgi:non-canonical poly(A) RNA polymerase PAPD5/7
MDEDFIPFPAKTYDNPVVISNDGAPWLSTKTNLQPNNIQTSPLVKLHNEIIQFADFMSLTKAELDERDLIIKEVEVIIKTISPTAKVKPFGSYISKMLTPMSDIDLVIINTFLNYIQIAELCLYL